MKVKQLFIWMSSEDNHVQEPSLDILLLVKSVQKCIQFLSLIISHVFQIDNKCEVLSVNLIKHFLIIRIIVSMRDNFLLEKLRIHFVKLFSQSVKLISLVHANKDNANRFQKQPQKPHYNFIWCLFSNLPLHDTLVLSSCWEQEIFWAAEDNIGHMRGVSFKNNSVRVLLQTRIPVDYYMREVICTSNDSVLIIDFELGPCYHVDITAIPLRSEHTLYGPSKNTGPSMPVFISQCCCSVSDLLSC